MDQFTGINTDHEECVHFTCVVDAADLLHVRSHRRDGEVQGRLPDGVLFRRVGSNPFHSPVRQSDHDDPALCVGEGGERPVEVLRPDANRLAIEPLVLRQRQEAPANVRPISRERRIHLVRRHGSTLNFFMFHASSRAARAPSPPAAQPPSDIAT